MSARDPRRPHLQRTCRHRDISGHRPRWRNEVHAQVQGQRLGGVVANGLALVLASAAIACAGGDPEPGAVRLAALTADAAADVLSDLAAVDDPDAAGVRDAFHAANVTALGNARLAHESAPRATQAAYAISLEASEAADTFAQSLSAAIEARDDLAAQASAAETAALIAEMVRRAAVDPQLRAKTAHARDACEAKRAQARQARNDAKDTFFYDEKRAQARQATEAANDAYDAYMAALRRRSRNLEALVLLNETLGDIIGQTALSDLVIEDANAETVAQAGAEAETLAGAYALTLADTDKKVETAEDRRPSAIAAYRAAANAWRALLETGTEQ